MLDVTNLIGFGAGRSVIDQTIVAYSTRTLSGGGTSITCNKPTGTQQGDLMIAFLNHLNQSQGSSLGYWTQPSGWTEVFDSNQRAISYKVAGPSEPASYSFGIDTFVVPQAAIVTIRPSAYDVVGAISASTTNPVAPSINTSESSLVFCVLTQNNGNTTASGWDIPGWTPLIPKFGATIGATIGSNLTLYMMVSTKTFDGGSTGTVATTSSNTTRAQLVSCKGVG